MKPHACSPSSTRRSISQASTSSRLSLFSKRPLFFSGQKQGCHQGRKKERQRSDFLSACCGTSSLRLFHRFRCISAVAKQNQRIFPCSSSASRGFRAGKHSRMRKFQSHEEIANS